MEPDNWSVTETSGLEPIAKLTIRSGKHYSSLQKIYNVLTHVCFIASFLWK